MKFWLGWVAEGNRHMKEVAVAAERAGFFGIGVCDHVAIPCNYQATHPSGSREFECDAQFPDPLISIATMAAATTRLEFMTYVYVLPMRDPFSVAKQVATVAMQSDYRCRFGIGAGWLTEEIELLGWDPRTRGRRMDEMLTIIEDLWDDGYAEFEGEFYKVPKIGQFPVPERRIPIWIGGKSPAALRRAARSDGWLGMNYRMQEIEQLLQNLEVERQRYLDEHEASRPFSRLVIPVEGFSQPNIDCLETWGVEETLVMCWQGGDPAFTSLQAKLDAVGNFGKTFIRA